MPAVMSFIAQSPSLAVASDYCKFGGSHYLLTVDRFSNWASLLCKTWNTCLWNKRASKCSVILYLPHFAFLKKFQAMEDQSRGQAEVCVKSVKRLIRTNVSTDGSLNSDAVMRGLL